MKYSETGQFTDEQIKIAKRIRRDLKKLGKTCSVHGKGSFLVAYLRSDREYAADMNSRSRSNYIIPSLDLGEIVDSGADDEEFFEEGYITED